MLTPRQLEIASYVAKGLKAREIAGALGVSPRTVEFHIEQAAQRIGGETRPRHTLTIWFLSLKDAA